MLATLCLLLGVHLAGIAGPSAIDIERLQEQMLRRFGPGPLSRLRSWHKLLGEAGSADETEKLRLANDFFNRHIRFEDDVIVWGEADYWATPLETLGKGQADCEDFAIAKYYTLKLLGVAEARLRLIYVRALLPESGGPRVQAHMVLAYYATSSGEPLVLDNLLPEIRLARQRSDLQPVYSFNAQGLWQGAAGQSSATRGGGNLSRWEDLQRRVRGEGIE